MLGGLAYGLLRFFEGRISFGVSVLLATLPFVGFLLVLKQATAAWTQVDATKCRGCGHVFAQERAAGSDSADESAPQS